MNSNKKYSHKIINEVHRHGFIQDKLKNREISKKLKLNKNEFEYVLYKNRCSNDECQQCNPRPMTITESLLTFFGG